MSDIDYTNTQTNEQSTFVSEKETMLKSQFTLLAEQHPTLMNDMDSSTSYELFTKTWDLCESYMMNVLKYALINKDKLINNTESYN